MDFMKAALAGKDPGDFPAAPETAPATHTVDTPDTAPAGDETH
jgi:hypothetical protein